LIASLEGHTGGVIFGEFISVDPDLVITAAKDNSLRLWRLSSSTLVDQINFSPNEISALAISVSGKLIAVGFWNGQLAIVKRVGDTLRLVEQLSGAEDMIQSLQIAPNEKTIFTGSRDNKAILWDFRIGHLQQLQFFEGHKDWVKFVRYHPSRPYLITASEDQQLIIWSSEGDPIQTIRVNGTISSIALNKKGDRLLIAIDRHLQLWNLQGRPDKWILLNNWEAYKESGIIKAGFIPGPKRHIYTISNSIDASDRLGKMWTEGGTLLAEMGEHSRHMTDFAVDPNGTSIVTADADGQLIIWPLDPEQIITYCDSSNIFKYPF
jgi:WD40 repeat protein